MPRKAAAEPEPAEYVRSTPTIEQPSEELIPVISRRVSNVWLTYYDDTADRPAHAPEKTIVRGTRRVLILPGLNYRRRAELLKCGPLGSGNVRLESRHPTEISEHEADELIKITTSREALRRWREAETRPRVVKALDRRLHDEQRGARG